MLIFKSFSSFLHGNKLFFSFSLIFALPPSIASHPYLSLHVLSLSLKQLVAIETELFKRRAKKLSFSLPAGSHSFHSAHLISLPPFSFSLLRHTNTNIHAHTFVLICCCATSVKLCRHVPVFFHTLKMSSVKTF